jgi:hypothetical protein
MSDDEQITAVMTRITDAPNIEGKVDALVRAVDRMWSIDSADLKGAELTRARRMMVVAAVGQFFKALGRRDLGLKWQN